MTSEPDNSVMSLQLLANIDVPDLPRATEFYCRALNLKVGRRFGAGAIELLGATSAIYLLEKPASSAASIAAPQKRDYGRHWTPVHLDFAVPDIAAAVHRAKRAGASMEGEIRLNTWGKIALLADPFGHGFCLIEFAGRGYDEIAT